MIFFNACSSPLYWFLFALSQMVVYLQVLIFSVYSVVVCGALGYVHAVDVVIARACAGRGYRNTLPVFDMTWAWLFY